MEQADTVLRAAGLRVTRPRLAVLAEVAAHPHADVDTIATGARAQLGSLSTQAVYNVVHALNEAGLLRRIESAGPPARFELATGDKHHHFVCRNCREIVDVPRSPAQVAVLNATSDADFLVDETEVTYWGLCANCRGHDPSHVIPPTTVTSSTNQVEKNA